MLCKHLKAGDKMGHGHLCAVALVQPFAGIQNSTCVPDVCPRIKKKKNRPAFIIASG